MDKQIPDTFDIPGKAAACLHHMLDMCDRKWGCVPYIGGTLGEDPPHFVHHGLDYSEVLPHVIYGAIAARMLSGSTKLLDVQNIQKALMLDLLSPRDGLVYTRPSPWYPKSDPLSIWEQARTLYALIYCFQETGDVMLIDRMDQMVDSLFSLTSARGRARTFPDPIVKTTVMGKWGIGALIDPLLKYHQITGNARAMLLAEGLAFFFLDQRNGLFNGEYETRGQFRSLVATINGISYFASLKGDKDLVDEARRIHDTAIRKCTSFGSTPCHEPACSDMELNMSALYLARLGFEEYYDQIERFVRNQTCEAQFFDADEWVREKASTVRLTYPKFVYRDYPADLHLLPYDDYENIVHRCVGGFMWCSPTEHKFMPASIMLCCSAHAMRSFQIIWENALLRHLNRVEVNFHFNIENETGEITSYDPYEGRVEVVLKDDAEEIRIRIPDFANGQKVTSFLDGAETTHRREGRYLVFSSVRKGARLSVLYPLCRRTTHEVAENHYRISASENLGNPVRETLEATWRGNTVIGLSPVSSAEKRIYKRAHLDTDATPYRTAAGRIPEYRLAW